MLTVKCPGVISNEYDNTVSKEELYQNQKPYSIIRSYNHKNFLQCKIQDNEIPEQFLNKNGESRFKFHQIIIMVDDEAIQQVELEKKSKAEIQ